MATKVKSFTLSEVLVVMIITVIVVGIAFNVLMLVQRQISTIKKNFQKTTELSLLEQRLWQDFNSHNNIIYNNEKLYFTSDIDTTIYSFSDQYLLHKNDTLPLKLTISKIYYMGNEVETGYIDTISLSAVKEIPDYTIFVSSQHDAAHFLNLENGF